MDSILTSIKKMLGISEEYDHFDADIIMDINSVLFVLTQLGVGPEKGYAITGASEKWDDFTGDSNLSELIKSYVYLKVRLIFDPPSSSAVIESTNKLISEFEWRINVYYENNKTEDPTNPGGDYEIYDGSYSVTPRVYQQELDTDNSILLKDISIEEIPISVTDNTSNGQTATIG